MKVLVIYANDCKQQVDQLRSEIADRFGHSSVLRLFSTDRKKSLIPHAWHKDAKKMIACADIIVYAVSEKSSTNKNVTWELRKAKKMNKYIVCLPMQPGLTPQNDCLFDIDKNTKQQVCLADTLRSKEELFAIIESFDTNSYIQLFHDNLDPGILLEQYRIFSESSENLVSRRQKVNSFYISANTALITVGGTIATLGTEDSLLAKLIVIIALSVPAFMLNISWQRMLQSYYINNQGKLKVLSMIEKKLAVSLYDAEWKAMKNKFSKNKYVSFTDNEKRMPRAFHYFYALIDLVCLCLLIPLISQLFH